MNGTCGSCQEEEDEVRGFRIDGEVMLLCEDCCGYMEHNGADIEGAMEAWGDDEFTGDW